MLALRDEGLYAFNVVFKVAHVWEVEVDHNFTSETWTVSLPQIADDLVLLYSLVEGSDSLVVHRVEANNLAVDLLQDWISAINLHAELFEKLLSI